MMIIIGVVQVPDFVATNKVFLLILNFLASTFVIVGVIYAISARLTGEYEKNKIFVTTLILALITIFFQILYELFLINDPEEKLNFKLRIFIQLILVSLDFFLIIRAKKMLKIHEGNYKNKLDS